MTLIHDDAVEAWATAYKPRQNHLNDDSGWGGIMYETYDAEWEYVKNQPNENVWTWVDGDEGSAFIAGRHWVNRIGYFVCDVPWTNPNAYVNVESWESDADDFD